MDYIRRFDIVLERDHYYAGETIKGHIVVENVENMKVRGEQDTHTHPHTHALTQIHAHMRMHTRTLIIIVR